jgi:hypothetical protein
MSRPIGVLALVTVLAVGIMPEPLIDGTTPAPTRCLGAGCVTWPEQVCPDEPPPGAGATPGGPYATTLTEVEEAWRPLVEGYFCAEYAVTEALHIIACESNGDPDAVNPSSGTTGLFQLHPGWFPSIAGDPADPEVNTAFARHLWRAAWGWSDWHCRPIP